MGVGHTDSESAKQFYLGKNSLSCSCDPDETRTPVMYGMRTKCPTPYLLSHPVVSMSPAARRTLLREMDIGSLTCVHIWMHAVHTTLGQAQTSLHKSWLGGKEKLCLTLPRQGIKPRIFGRIWYSDALTTELRSPSSASSSASSASSSSASSESSSASSASSSSSASSASQQLVRR